MSRPPKMPRSELLDRLTATILALGYDGASLADFSASTGLSKASLYHFFPGGKVEIAEQCLIRSGMKLQKWVIAPLQSRKVAAERLMISLDGLARYYEGDQPACLMNILGLSTASASFLPNITAGLHAWRDALKLLFLAMGHSDSEAANAADMFLEQVQGSLIFCRLQGSRAPLESFLNRHKNKILA